MAISVTRTKQARDYHTFQSSFLYDKIKWNTSGIGGGSYVVGKIPAGALIKDTIVRTNVAFNAATTNVFTMGTTASGTDIITSDQVDEATVGSIVESDTSYGLSTTNDVTVYAKYTQSGTAASAGELEVWVEFLMPK